MEEIPKNDPFYQKEIDVKIYKKYLHIYEIKNYNIRFFLFVCMDTEKDSKKILIEEKKIIAPNNYPVNEKVQINFIKFIKLVKPKFKLFYNDKAIKILTIEEKKNRSEFYKQQYNYDLFVKDIHDKFLKSNLTEKEKKFYFKKKSIIDSNFNNIKRIFDYSQEQYQKLIKINSETKRTYYSFYKNQIEEEWKTTVKSHIENFLNENVKGIVLKKKKYCALCDKNISYNNWSEHKKTNSHINFIENALKKKEREKKIICECGSILMPISMKKHLKSDKHLNFIKNLN